MRVIISATVIQLFIYHNSDTSDAREIYSNHDALENQIYTYDIRKGIFAFKLS